MSCGCHGKVPQTGWPETTEMYCLAIWRLEVQNSGVGGTVLSLKPVRGSFLASWRLLVICWQSLAGNS